MPTIYRYTPAELIAIQQSMRDYPPDQVERDYRAGKLQLKDKLLLLQNYGRAEREIAMRSEIAESKAKSAEVGKLGGGGYSGALFGEWKYYVQNVAKEFKAAWTAAQGQQPQLNDYITKTPQQIKQMRDGSKSEAVFRAMMGSLEALKIFDIPGDVAERWVLEADPEATGQALATNWALWILANGAGISTILKAPFAAAGGAARGLIKGSNAAADFVRYLKDPVKYAVEQAGAYEAVTATKLAKKTAENTVLKSAGVAGAAIEAEAKGGTQAFKIAVPKSEISPAMEAALKFRHDAINNAFAVVDAADQIATQGGVSAQAVTAAKAIKEEARKALNTLNELAGPENAVEIAGKLQAHLDELNKLSGGLGILPSENPAKLQSIIGKASTDFKAVIDDAVGQDWNVGFKFPTPQEIESQTVKELINSYAERSKIMIRSSTEPFNYEGVSHAKTKAAAAASPTDFWEILQRGLDAPVSATELERIRPVHEEIMKNFNKILDEASKDLAGIGDGARPDLVMAYKAHLAAAEITNPAFLSARGQAGRALEYAKTMKPLINDSLTFDVTTHALGSEKLLEGNNKAIAYTMNKLYLLGKEERGKLLAAAAEEPSDSTFMQLLYKTLLFARPGIHAANMTGNTGSAMLHGVNKSAASLMPWSETTWREASAYWSGMADSRTKFFEIVKKALQRGEPTKAGVEIASERWWVKKGPLGMLGAEDEFFEEVVGNGLAKSLAVTEGLTKWDEIQAAVKAGAVQMPRGQTKKKFLADFIDSSMSDPHNYERLIEATRAEADYIIFRSPLSQGGELIARGIRRSILDYAVPVVKFPINGMKMARDWTPVLQMFSKKFVADIAEGGAKADAQRAKMTLSWMISSQIYEAALRGDFVPDGPSNPEARAAWIAAGNTPRTLHGVPIQWAEPFATWFSFIGNLAHAKAEMTEDSVQAAFEAVVVAGAKAMENMYWLRIMEGVTNAISDVKAVQDLNDIIGSVVKIIGQPVKTIATGGTVGRVVGEMVNPEVADQKFYDDFDLLGGEIGDLKNWFFANTMFGKDTRPKLNSSGNIMITPPVIGTAALENLGLSNPVARGITSMFLPTMRQNTGENDPIGSFLDKHGLTLHNNWKYYGGTTDPDKLLPIADAKPRVSLTGDQAYNWQFISLNDAKHRRTGKTWRETIAELDSDPRFAAKDRQQKQDQVNSLYATYREMGRKLLGMNDPDVAEKEAERNLLEAQGKNNPSLIMRMLGASASESQSSEQNAPVEPRAQETIDFGNPAIEFAPNPEVE